MRVSWVILTYNRRETVEKSIKHNMFNAGVPWDEMVWVDNGSKDGTVEMMRGLGPDVCVLHKENLGVGPGYNRCMALASSDFIVITGCDVLMPKDWLKTFMTYMEAIPNTGVACMYSHTIKSVPERYRGKKEIQYADGIPYIEAMPMEARIFRKSMLKSVGYLREDFGLYGWEDVEWGARVEKFTRQHGQINYKIPGQYREHMGTEGISVWDNKDPKAYWEFKQKESKDPKKQELMEQLRKANWPYYSPF